MISTKELYKNTKDLEILLVEDDEQLRAQMGAMLGELFQTVDLAQDGKTGLSRYEQKIQTDSKAYDLVITDINMPVMNGIEMIHAIYTVSPLQPILVMSAHNESDYLLELLHTGVNGFMIKPLKHQSLINTLSQVTQAIVNERLVLSHYKKIERLNAKLSLQSEKLRQSNEELYDKNLALEKSMRIIEGMHHKNQLYRNIHISAATPGLPAVQQEDIHIPHGKDDTPSLLEEIETRISNITREYETGKTDDLSFIKLSDAVRIYAHSLADKTVYTTLIGSLKELSLAISVHPKCTHTEENKRIFNMLESFFFIYSRWEKEWSKIDEESFKAFSHSISDEIALLIEVWQCKE
jgi:YesN/AraC family two-component response regulator